MDGRTKVCEGDTKMLSENKQNLQAQGYAVCCLMILVM